ncbi:MAG: DNA primase [Chloracidobacterium sp. CP2_5A]|nr:MAG: DNA primase [Chloracidobacterium sp. CP2_5A]
MPFDRQALDDLRSQADIARVISNYVTLRKRGASYIACCPFHNEKTPSFNVHPGKQVFKCFGCGVGGDVFTFVMRMEGVAFAEAARMVAEVCGLPLPETRVVAPEAGREADERERLLRLHELAARFFQEQLARPEGYAAREYLASRDVGEATLAALRLGYAPDRWEALTKFLRDHGATETELERSGLVSVTDGGSRYDRFRGRLMFPIADSQGRIIAFGGRTLGDGEPKYLNSPETPLYVKGRHLYGLHLTKEAARRAGFVILVEGYMDFLRLYQGGARNVAATLGTALTEAQARQLRRYLETPKVVINFDSDHAGQAATRRSFELFLEQGFRVNVLRLPEGKDPDDFVRARGMGEYRERLKQSQPLVEYLADMARLEHDVSRPAGRAQAVNAVLPYIVKIGDAIERDLAAERLADRLQLDANAIRGELRRAARERRAELAAETVEAATKLTLAERNVLQAVLAHPPLCAVAFAELDDELIDLLPGRVFFRAARDVYAGGGTFEYDSLARAVARWQRAETRTDARGQLDFFSDSDAAASPLDLEMENYVAELLLRAEPPKNEEQADRLRAILEDGLLALQQWRIERRSAALHHLVRAAAESNDEALALHHANERLRLKRARLAALHNRQKRS